MIQKLPGLKGQLNVFQRVMLDWSELHPYNAAHTFHLAGPLRADALREAIGETYRFNRLGLVELDEQGAYHHETDDTPELEVLSGGSSPERRLTEHLTAELNRRFERPRCRPFRFSTMEAGPDHHYVSVTYDHWVADSIATRLVLRHVLGRYLRIADPENEHPLTLHPGTYRDVFQDRFGPVRAAQVAGRALAQWWSGRRAAQIPYSCSTEMSVHYELYHTAPGTAPRLAAYARSLGVTVHDVILAALSRAMVTALPRRSSSRTRAQFLGSIVDTRDAAQTNLSESLGTFLAFFLVRCPLARSATLAELTRQIAAQTGPIKAERRYLDSLVNLKLASQLWPWLSAQARPHAMRKALPMTAGVSNVRLRDSWIDRYRPGHIRDYARVSPTGPTLPLVVTPTTMGDELNVGVTYRAAGFSRAKIQGVMTVFLEQLERPEGSKQRGPEGRPDRVTTASGARAEARQRPVSVRAA